MLNRLKCLLLNVIRSPKPDSQVSFTALAQNIEILQRSVSQDIPPAYYLAQCRKHVVALTDAFQSSVSVAAGKTAKAEYDRGVTFGLFGVDRAVIEGGESWSTVTPPTAPELFWIGYYQGRISRDIHVKYRLTAVQCVCPSSTEGVLQAPKGT